MILKENVQAELDKMPDEFTLDELVERLIVLDKIEKGLSQSALGNVVSEEELDKTVDKWFE